MSPNRTGERPSGVQASHEQSVISTALQLSLLISFMAVCFSPQQQRREKELRKQQEREQRRHYEEQMRREEERRRAEHEQVQRGPGSPTDGPT